MLTPEQEERFHQLLALSRTYAYLTDAESRELSALKEERDKPAEALYPVPADITFSWSDKSAIEQLLSGERNTLTAYGDVVRTDRTQDAANYLWLRVQGHTTEELQP